MSDEPEPGSTEDIERALRLLNAQQGESVYATAWRWVSRCNMLLVEVPVLVKRVDILRADLEESRTEAAELRDEAEALRERVKELESEVADLESEVRLAHGTD
jgi:uncharacterized protein YlxW (UPF0749 family)